MTPEVPPSNNQKLTTSVALAYLNAIKDIFQDKMEKYNEFLEVMKGFKTQRIDTNGVMMRVKELFKGHRELILGFNIFLPHGYEIKLPEEKKPVEFDEAFSFVNKIKTRFQDEEHIYKAFLDILNMYRRDNKSIQDVYQEVAVLFQSHLDLLEEFKHFLPNTSAPTDLQHPFSIKPVLRRDDRSPLIPYMRHPQMERVYISNPENDLSVDRPDLNHEQRRTVKEKDRKEELVMREQDWAKKEFEQDSRDFGLTRKRKASRMFDDASELMHQGGEGTENFGMCNTSTSTSSFVELNAMKNVYTQEFAFCEKVKEKLHPDAYQDFLKCLYIYSKEIASSDDLKNLVSHILGKHSDLMEGFNKFLAQCENKGGFLAGVFNTKSLWNEENMAKSVKIEEDRDGERECDGRERECERDKDRERFDKGPNYALKVAANHKVPLVSNEENFNLYKPISELDLSNCKRGTPSYRLLPKNLITAASQRTKLGASLLNDAWVSVTSGSEDYSFKHMRKNQYEESLFRCEDDRFELDMLIESVNSTTKRVEELLKKIEDRTIKPESPFLIEKHFTSLHLRCIERLYGDHGLDVMDVLRKNASLALPVILTRLKQKQEEWSKCCADFNKVWAEVYSKNYHNSLDHRSFYFKQQDAKNLTAKALLSEVKEISEKKRKEDDGLLAIAAGNRRPTIPSIEFEYPDLDIFNDIYQLVKYSSHEMCTSSDQFDKVMRIWTTFLEPIFGVPPRSQGTDDTEGVSKTKALTKYNIVSAGESNGICEADGFITNSKSVKDDAIIFNRDAMDIDNGFRDNDRPVHLNDNILKAPISAMTKSSHICTEFADEAHVRSEVLHSLEIGNTAKTALATSASTAKNSKPNRYRGISSQNEREEGELSPNGDFEEDNFISLEDTIMDVSTRQKGSSVNRSFLVKNEQVEALCETAGENGINADEEGEESIQRSADDSGNASEAKEDISGSESGNECSHEDHEEEDVNQDAKDESESEAEGIADANDAEGEIASLPISEHFLHTVKPISMHVPSSMQENGDSCSNIFYGNDSFYVFFRLHQTLYERMLSAKISSAAAERKRKFSKDLTTDLYIKLKTALHSLLDGTADNTKFEDDCRAILGTQSYLLFTLDKLIYKIVKQLQAIVSDDMENKLCQLYFYEKSRQPGRFFDELYHENARVLLHDESVYRFECSSNSTKLSIQLMEYGLEKPEATAVSIEPNFSSYMFNDYLSSTSERNGRIGIFMKRNKRKFEGDDELDGLQIFNGLECKIASRTSKVSYVLDTEDVLFRAAKRRSSPRAPSASQN